MRYTRLQACIFMPLLTRAYSPRETNILNLIFLKRPERKRVSRRGRGQHQRMYYINASGVEMSPCKLKQVPVDWKIITFPTSLHLLFFLINRSNALLLLYWCCTMDATSTWENCSNMGISGVKKATFYTIYSVDIWNAAKTAREIFLVHDNDIIVKKTGQGSPAKFEMVLGILTMPRSGPPAEFGNNYFFFLNNFEQRRSANNLGISRTVGCSHKTLHRNLKFGYFIKSVNPTRNYSLTLHLKISHDIESHVTTMTNFCIAASPVMSVHTHEPKIGIGYFRR